MRNEFVDELLKIAVKDSRVMAVLADNGLQVFDEYQRQVPRQFLNVGIAEANMVALSAGLASGGFVPFAYTILSFLTYRAFEFIRDDVCYQKKNVKLVGIGAGFAYSTLGPTHHGTEDISAMRAMPGLKILCPSDPTSARQAAHLAYETPGPVYIRLGKGKEPVLWGEGYRLEWGKSVCFREGTDVALFSTGSILAETLEAARTLKADHGVECRVVDFPSVEPFDREAVLAGARECQGIVTVEEHSLRGGMGGLVAEILVDSGVHARVKRLGLSHDFCHSYGSVSDLRKACGISSMNVVQCVLDMLGRLR